MSMYFFKLAMSSQHWGEVAATKDVKLWDPVLAELLHESTTEARRCHMLDQQLFLLLGHKCGVIHHEARPGGSRVETRGMRAAVRHSKACGRDVQRSWGDLVFIFRSCIVSVLHALRPKAAPSSERKCIKKRVEKYLPSEQRQDAVHQEAELYFTFQLSQLQVNLPVIHWPHNLIMTLQEI